MEYQSKISFKLLCCGTTKNTNLYFIYAPKKYIYGYHTISDYDFFEILNRAFQDFKEIGIK